MSLFAKIVGAEIFIQIKSKLVKHRKATLEQFLNSLEPNEKSVFLSTAVEELFDFTTLEKEVKAKSGEKREEPVTNEEEYKDKVLAFLKEGGLGEGRGFSTTEIVTACKGDTPTTRKVLDLLKTENKAWATGNTKSKRWVTKDLMKKAEEALIKEQGK